LDAYFRAFVTTFVTTILEFGLRVGRWAGYRGVMTRLGLGVDDKTIQRWSERGLLRAVRLRSGIRPLRPEDVDAARQRMFSGFAPFEESTDAVRVHARPVD